MRELARTMVELGAAHGVPTRALLTDMNSPLGATVGNALEVAEALEVLAGGGPPDVVELTLRLAEEMLELAGVDARDPAQTLRDGTAMDRFADWSPPRAATFGTVADRCALRDRDRLPERHNGRYRRDGSGAGGLAARRGQVAPGRAGAIRRGRPDPPPSRRAGRGRRAAVHPLHRHPGALRRRDGRIGRRVERRRDPAGPRPLIIDRIAL